MRTIIDNGTGADALWLNMLYSIASGGDFWESGGGLSSAGSSTSIDLSVSQVTVNIGGQTVKHGSQPVTLSPTSGEYRTDVIYATSTGIEVQKGQEMAKAPGKDHPAGPKQFPSIWQPAPDNGSLIPGVPLWCVHITPGDSASNDIGSWQWQDRRMNGETINSDAIVSLLENYDTGTEGAVQTTVANSDALGGISQLQMLATSSLMRHTKSVPGGSSSIGDEIWVPPHHQFVVWRCGVVSKEQVGGINTRVQFYPRRPDGSLGDIITSTDKRSAYVDDPLVTGDRGQQVLIRLDNRTSSNLTLTGHGFVTLLPKDVGPAVE